MHFRLNNTHQARHMSEAINRAMKLPEDHRFGDTFLTDYVFERTDLLTTFRGMTRWCRECKFYYKSETGVRYEFRMSPPRHKLLLSFLDVLSICMGEMLRNYGGDLPLPPGLEENEL